MNEFKCNAVVSADGWSENVINYNNYYMRLHKLDHSFTTSTSHDIFKKKDDHFGYSDEQLAECSDS